MTEVREHFEHHEVGINAVDIFEALKMQIAFHRHPSSERLFNVLNRSNVVMDEAVIFEVTRADLTKYAETRAAVVHRPLMAEVIAQFPDQYQTEPSVTPRQYLRSNGFDMSQKHILWAAGQAAVADVQTELCDAMQADFDEFQQYDQDYDNQTLEAELTDLLFETKAIIDALVADIKLELPDDAVVAKAQKEVMEDAMRTGRLFIPGRKQLPPIENDAAVNLANVSRLMGELADILNNYSTDEQTVARSLAGRFKPKVAAEIYDYIAGRYTALAEQATKDRLPKRLQAAYARVADPEYVHVSQRERLAVTTIMPEVSLELVTENVLRSQPTNGFELDPIGAIQSPFPWLHGTNVTMQLASAHDHNLLFCQAFPDVMQAISNELRREKANRKVFQALQERFLGIELTDPKGYHPHIDRVRHQTDTDFDGLQVYKFGNVGANAKRVYYVKTNADRYGVTRDLAADYGLPETASLLVQIGETDKANQQKMLGRLGASRVYGRRCVVGSK